MDKNISFTLKVWRQRGPKEKGHFQTIPVKDMPGDTSFLEMLDIVNEELINKGEEPIVFDHDCREGICGMCSLYINGHPHGPATGATTCQIYIRRFNDGDTITVEPWRSAGFPVIRLHISSRQNIGIKQRTTAYTLLWLRPAGQKPLGEKYMGNG